MSGSGMMGSHLLDLTWAPHMALALSRITTLTTIEHAT